MFLEMVAFLFVAILALPILFCIGVLLKRLLDVWLRFVVRVLLREELQ